MNEQISLVYSASESAMTAVVTISADGSDSISFPVSSITGGNEEAALFSAIQVAIASYRSAKGF